MTQRRAQIIKRPCVDIDHADDAVPGPKFAEQQQVAIGRPAQIAHGAAKPGDGLRLLASVRNHDCAGPDKGDLSPIG